MTCIRIIKDLLCLRYGFIQSILCCLIHILCSLSLIFSIFGYRRVLTVLGRFCYCIFKFTPVNHRLGLCFIKGLLGGFYGCRSCIYFVLGCAFLTECFLSCGNCFVQSILCVLVHISLAVGNLISVCGYRCVIAVLRGICYCIFKFAPINHRCLLGIVKSLLGGLHSRCGCVYFILGCIFVTQYSLGCSNSCVKSILCFLSNVFCSFGKVLAVFRNRHSFTVIGSGIYGVLKIRLINGSNLLGIIVGCGCILNCLSCRVDFRLRCAWIVKDSLCGFYGFIKSILLCLGCIGGSRLQILTIRGNNDSIFRILGL